MRKRLVRFLLILIVTIFSIPLKVDAAVITSTDKEVQSASGNVTISVNSKQTLGAYTLRITDTAGLEIVNASGGEISADKKTITYASSSGTTNLGTYTFKVPTVTSDTTYKIKFLVSGIETTDLETIADENNTAKLTVKAPPPKVEDTTTTPPATTVTKSSEARLKSLGIKPNNFSGFKKDKTEYSTTVPNSVTEVEIYGEKEHNKAKVEGFRKVSLNEGNNTFEVKVTAEDGTTTKTYKITIKRKTKAEEENENGEARLKDLGIKPKEYDFSGFDSEKLEYSVEVPNEIEEIEVFATAMDSKAQITGIGMITLEEGQNELKIEVIAVNGNKKTYIITVTRKETEKKEILGLSTLEIKGINLDKEFYIDTYEYTVTLEKDINFLDIEAIANNEDVTIEIVGNENLQQGENLITILVTNKKTEEVVTYQIIVNKNITAVEEIIQKSWLRPSTWGKEEKIKIAIILVLVILIIWAIILKIKISKESHKNKKVDFPGAEELDKAIAEHHELVEEPNDVKVTIKNNEEEMNYEQSNSKEEVEQQNYVEEIAKSRFENIEEQATVKTKRRGKHF